MLIRILKNRAVILSLAAVVTFFALVLGVGFGSVKLTFGECIRGLFFGTGTEGIIIRSLRLPRVLGALLSGAALGGAGLLLQSAVANPLAAPNTIGINAGAGAAVMLSLVFIKNSFVFQSVFAFLGALAAALVTLFIASRFGGMSRGTVVLAGVAVGAVFNAVISYLSVRFPDVLSSYASFSVGGFSGILWKDITAPSAVILFMLALGMLLAPLMNLLDLGDELAASFGVKTRALRFLLVVISAALASASVSYAGLIGFVGLIAPHVSARLIGSDKRFLYPMTLLFGSSLTVLSDLLARVLFAPSELPSGILLNAVGAPFFLALLIFGRRKGDV
ncbi:MAG: iron ABC transporter permease [Clostridia bacterium]|nr:iron ABC transporter permease [Clostridia bacterium]